MTVKILAIAVVSAGCARSSDVVARCDVAVWSDAFGELASERPDAQIDDYYKLAHQGIRGSEHAVGNRADAAEWMSRELATHDSVRLSTFNLSAGSASARNEVLVDTLPPDGRFVRVNLRPFVERGGDTSALINAFVATANKPANDTVAFACVEESLVGLSASLGLFPVDSLRQYFAMRREGGFSAAHHSKKYERAYHPSYRVVSREFVGELVSGGLRD